MVDDFPSAAAGPDCGAWKPTLICADALPANNKAAAKDVAIKFFFMMSPEAPSTPLLRLIIGRGSARAKHPAHDAIFYGRVRSRLLVVRSGPLLACRLRRSNFLAPAAL